MAYILGREQYGRIYGCNPRSIGNYEQKGAPLDEPSAMYHWLWKQRSQPAGFTGKTEAEIVDRYAYEVADGEELDAHTREHLEEHLFYVDTRQLCALCAILAAEKKGYFPPYGEAVRAALQQIRDGIKAAHQALGISTDDDDADEEEEESGENDGEE